MHHKHLHFDLLKHKWNIEIVEFYIYTLLKQIGNALISVFVPIYLYADLDYSLLEIMLFYIIFQIFFLIFIPFSAKVIEKIGLKHSIALHLPAFAIFAYCLRFLSGDFYQDLWLIVLILAIRAIPKTPSISAETIFISRHVVKNQKEEGKSLASLKILLIFASLVSPLAGGLITKFFGFDTFFTVAVVVLLLAAVPLMMTKDEYFKIDESPAELMKFTLKKLPKNFKLAEFGRWMSQATLYLLWPLFIFIVLADVSDVGMVVSISGMIAMLVTYFVGKKVDEAPPKKLLSRMTKIASGLYFLRVLFPTPILLITTDAINRIVNPILMIPYEKYYYDYIKSNRSLLEISIGTNFIIEFFFMISFIVFALYFGALELLNIEVTYVSFVILFVIYGFFMLFMSRISRLAKTNEVDLK